eukprot:gene12917-20842_t
MSDISVRKFRVRQRSKDEMVIEILDNTTREPAYIWSFGSDWEIRKFA